MFNILIFIQINKYIYMLLVIIFSTYDHFLWLGHKFTTDLKVQRKYLRQEVRPIWCFIIFLALAEMEICQTQLLSQVSFFFSNVLKSWVCVYRFFKFLINFLANHQTDNLQIFWRSLDSFCGVNRMVPGQ